MLNSFEDKKELDILLNISDYCENNCESVLNCPEEECILFRIETIITSKKRE